MKRHWFQYPHVRTVEPFVVVDAYGRPCGKYMTIPSADSAVDFLNEYGLHKPYRIVHPDDLRRSA